MDKERIDQMDSPRTAPRIICRHPAARNEHLRLLSRLIYVLKAMLASKDSSSPKTPTSPSCVEPTNSSKGRLALDIIKELHQTVLPMDSQE